MVSKPESYTRRNSLRLKGFDYSWPRIYFVTINGYDRRPVFKDHRVACTAIDSLKEQRLKLGFTVYVYCLMPDHFHALIGPGTSNKSLGAICGSFKSISTRRFWRWYDGKLCHRQFYDHIIRNRDDFDETRSYEPSAPAVSWASGRLAIYREARLPASGSGGSKRTVRDKPCPYKLN